MSYNLDPNREMPYMVVDSMDEVGREGVYAGSLEDCQEYLSEQSQHCSCLTMDIVPNPNYKKQISKETKEDDFIVKTAKEWFPACLPNSLTNRVSFIHGAKWIIEELMEYSHKHPEIKEVNEFIEKFKEKLKL